MSSEAGSDTEAGHARDTGRPGEPHGVLDSSDAMFPHVMRWSRGYDPDQVDTFFAKARAAYEGPLESSMGAEDVRSASFDLVRGGYAPGAVDRALDRLEGAFLRRERAAYVSRHGLDAWRAAVEDLTRSLQPRAARPHGQRFAPPTHGRGYAAEDVDRLVDRLAAHFEHEEALTADQVRSTTFRTAKGERAYAEGPVDAYLDRAVKVLLAVE